MANKTQVNLQRKILFFIVFFTFSIEHNFKMVKRIIKIKLDLYFVATCNQTKVELKL